MFGSYDVCVTAAHLDTYSEGTKARIQKEAARLFIANGYHGVSMREVAEAVGVTKPALYHHFVDKEALFLALLQDAVMVLQQIVHAAKQQAGIQAQLDGIVNSLLRTAPEQRVGWQLASELRHISEKQRTEFENAYRKVWMGGITEIMAAAISNGELRDDVPASVHTRAFLALVFPVVNSPEGQQHVIHTLLSLYWDGAKK